MSHQAFPTTHWSLLDRFGQTDHDSRFDEFLARYRPALVAFLQSKLGSGHPDIEDIIQGFIVDKILQGNILQQADATRGKLRHLMMKSLQNYANNYHRDRHTARRSPGAPILSLSNLDQDASRVPAAEERYDIEWARALLAQALDQAASEAKRKNLSNCWNVFVDRVIDPLLHGTEIPSYETLTAKYEFDSPGQASNRMVTARRMYVRNLRMLVSEYITSPEGIDQEIHELQTVLKRSFCAD